MHTGTPPAEVEIDATLVRSLLYQQHPDLADLPLRLLDTGWDNVMIRLGDEFVVRLPRRELAVTLLEHEQDWLPTLVERLPLPVPAPVRMGHPGHGYPWRWSVLPWIDGVAADLDPPCSDQAGPLAEFLRALHTRAPDNAPSNGFRGVPLQERAVGGAAADRPAEGDDRSDDR